MTTQDSDDLRRARLAVHRASHHTASLNLALDHLTALLVEPPAEEEPGHTPGPWTVGPSSTAVINPVEVSAYFSRGPAVEERLVVARAYSWVGDLIEGGYQASRRRRDEARANAHLIAASPDLLAVAEDIAADGDLQLRAQQHIDLRAAIAVARNDPSLATKGFATGDGTEGAAGTP